MPDAKEIIKTVRYIELTTRGLVESLVAGNYKSVFKGQGVEFSELREYFPGDDIRTIDWNVTARYDHPFVKSFIEERDLRVYVAMDVSGSGDFGNTISKKSKAIEITATLLFSALRNNDSCGLFLWSDKIENYIPARKGRRHLFKVISKLITHEPLSRKTNIAESLKKISNVLKKRSLIFVVSDFFDSSFSKELSKLKERHDVILVRLLDKRELQIPPVGLVELEDEETGEQITVDTTDPRFQKAYSKQVELALAGSTFEIKKSRTDIIDLDTETGFETPLRRFFGVRKARAVR